MGRHAGGPASGGDPDRLPRAILLNPTDNGLGICRPLVRRGVEVHVLAGDSDRCFMRSRGVVSHEMPTMQQDARAWVDELIALGDRPGVLIPLSDAASELVVKHRHELPESLAAFEGPGGGHLELMDKVTLYEVAERAGVRVPWSFTIRSSEDLERAAAGADYPCVLKPSLSHVWRGLFGDERVLEISGPDELREKARAPLDAGLELMLNEYVPGPEATVEEAVLLRTADGSYPLVFGARKLRQHPVNFGAGALVLSERTPEAIEMSKRVLDEAGFVGISGIEFKRHERTGELVMLEVNVRTTQFIGLGNVNGADAAWRLYATLAGIELAEQDEQLYGVKILVPILELRALRERFRRRDLSVGQVLSSYRGVRDLGLLDPRDPLPMLAYIRARVAIGRGDRRGRAAG